MEKETDELIETIEKNRHALHKPNLGAIKVRNHQENILGALQSARDNFSRYLKAGVGTRQELHQCFEAEDFRRLTTIITVLDSQDFSATPNGNNDERISGCRGECEAIKAILEDLGLGTALKFYESSDAARLSQQAIEVAKEKEEAAKSQPLKVEEAVPAPAKAAEKEPETASSVKENLRKVPEPERAEPPKPAPAGDPSKFEVTGELTATKTANAAVKEVLEGIDEEFVKKVKKCETPEEIRELGVPMGFVAGKPDKQWPDRPGDWLVWMCGRVYLNDDTLKELPFTNVPIPSSADHDMIIPRLMEGLKQNEHLEKANLQNTQFTSFDAAKFEAVIGENKALKYLNLDSNPLNTDAAVILARSLQTTETLQELRINNLMGGVATNKFIVISTLQHEVENALAEAIVKSNTSLLKLGYNLTDPSCRDRIDRKIMKNNDLNRKRKQEEKKRAAEAAGA